MARRRRRKRKHNPSGFWAWAKEHWFLTFLLASSAISTVGYVTIAAMRSGKALGPATKPQEPEVRPEDIPLMPVPFEV